MRSFWAEMLIHSPAAIEIAPGDGSGDAGETDDRRADAGRREAEQQ